MDDLLNELNLYSKKLHDDVLKSQHAPETTLPNNNIFENYFNELKISMIPALSPIYPKDVVVLCGRELYNKSIKDDKLTTPAVNLLVKLYNESKNIENNQYGFKIVKIDNYTTLLKIIDKPKLLRKCISFYYKLKNKIKNILGKIKHE